MPTGASRFEALQGNLPGTRPMGVARGAQRQKHCDASIRCASGLDRRLVAAGPRESDGWKRSSEAPVPAGPSGGDQFGAKGCTQDEYGAGPPRHRSLNVCWKLDDPSQGGHEAAGRGGAFVCGHRFSPHGIVSRVASADRPGDRWPGPLPPRAAASAARRRNPTCRSRSSRVNGRPRQACGSSRREGSGRGFARERSQGRCWVA